MSEVICFLLTESGFRHIPMLLHIKCNLDQIRASTRDMKPTIFFFLSLCLCIDQILAYVHKNSSLFTLGT